MIKARSSLWLPRVVAHTTPKPSPNSQLYHVTPLLDEDRDGFDAHYCSCAGALPLTEHQHKPRSVLRHPGSLGHSRLPPCRGIPGSSAVFSMAVDWLGFGYAALVTSGGIIGYAKAGSLPSLAAGLFFGSLAGLGAYQVSQNPNNIWVSLITSGALTAVMGTRFYHSRKFMPAGLIAGVSLLMVGRLALKMLEKPQEK